MNRPSAFQGQWSSRSLIHEPDLDVESNNLRFGAGTLELSVTPVKELSGSLGGSGWSLALSGGVTYGHPFTARFQGIGEIAGATWVYGYQGFLAPIWPNGVDRRPAMVGSIVRTVPHSSGQARAGLVASFYAAEQGD